MPRHRNLNLQKFIDSIPSQLLEEYFRQKISNETSFPAFNFEAIKTFLDSLKDGELKNSILEDFRHINDICEKNMNILVKSLHRYKIKTRGEEEKHELAMDIFLHNKDAFNYAYDYYCLYNSSTKMSHYNIEAPDMEITPQNIQRFQERIQEFYTRLAKGRECIVRYYDEEGQTFFVIIHGSYKQSKIVWENSQTKTIVFRPANEDILQYNKNSSVLSIKAPYQKDKDNYIKSFTEEIVCDKSQADRSDIDITYSLKPLQNGKFSFDGNEDIESVTLLEIKLIMLGSTSPEIHIKSSDVLKTLEENFEELSLSSGELVHAKFLFILDIDRKKKRITVEIAPPNVTDLPRKRYAEIIGAYLKENEIKLID